jgi:outer membrane protein assembly factor BamB
MLKAIDLASGTMLWQISISTSTKCIAPGSVSQGIVLLHHNTGDVETIQAIDARTGVDRWHFEFDANFWSPLEVEIVGELILGTTNTGLFALRSSSGELLWELDLEPDALAHFLMTDRRVCYVSHHVGDLYDLIAVDTRTGSVLWRKSLLGFISSSAATMSDYLFVENTADPDIQEVVALRSSTGEIVWRVATGPMLGLIVDGDQVIVKLGHVVLSTRTVYLQALVGLDIATGREVWSIQLPIVFQGYTELSNGVGVVIPTSSLGVLQALDIQTGERLWHLSDIDTLADFRVFRQVTEISQGTVFVDRRQGAKRWLEAINIVDGGALWSYEPGGEPDDLWDDPDFPFLVGTGRDSVYGMTWHTNQDCILYSLDASTGRLKWQFEVPIYGYYGVMEHERGVVLVLSSTAGLIAVKS